MTINEIQEKLLALKDEKYKEFHSKLIPNVDERTVIGVRVPLIKNLAKELVKEYNKETDARISSEDIENFFNDVPHKYYEENQLHGFLIDQLNYDFEKCLYETERFLPYINNWAVSDSYKPKGLKKDIDRLYQNIEKWMKSSKPYTVRVGVVLQISWFLDKNFQDEMLEKIINVAIKWSDESFEAIEEEKYYVLMAVAWYFSVALIKQYSKVIGIFTEKTLPVWVHNKALQKAMESKRVSDERKEMFRELKVK